MPPLSFANYQKQASFSQLCGHKIAHWQSHDFEHNTEQACVLMIHGFPSAAWDWHYQWKHLASDYRLLTLDMLGFGLSDKPQDHQYSLLEQADIIQALLAEKGVSKVHILAHDYGNSVAQELLTRENQQPNSETPSAHKTHGYKILSICWLNGGLFASHHRPLFSQKLLKSPLGSIAIRFMHKGSLAKGLKTIFSQKRPPTNAEIAILWQLILHNNGKKVLPKLLAYIDERKVFGKAWVENMISTTVPLYFINGAQDPISGQHMLDHYIDVIPTPHTTRLEVGHYPQLEAPEQVLALYQQFLIDLTE